ncbi:Alcohol acetyltransferase [Penicillium expansum]|nr:Alcohol acetyltransferase [Penicillium expansum]
MPDPSQVGLEQYSTSRHQVGFYLNVAVSATYFLPDAFVLPIKNYVYQACEAAITEHPSLSAIVADDHTQDPYFVRLPEIDLDQVVSFQDRKPGLLATEADGEPTPDLDLQTLLATQHNTPFRAPNPFWRVCVLLGIEDERKFTVAFVYHHAIGDGTSGKAFHQTFLRALGAMDSSDQTKSIIKSPQLPLLPNIERVHPMSLSLFYLAKKIFQAKIYSRRPTGLWTGSKILVPSQTRLRLVPFSKLLVGAIRDRCRQEGTTITALLQTIVARSIFAHIPPEFTQLACTGAISSRRWLPDVITDESVGVWVQDYEETYSRATVAPSDGSFPWAEAKRSRETIESVLKMEGKNASTSLLQFVDDFQEELCLSKVGKDRDKSFEVSNVGVLGPQTNPDLPSIKGMVFSQCASVMGNAIEVSAVTGGDGCLVLAVSWQQGVVEADLINEVVESIKQELYSVDVV